MGIAGPGSHERYVRYPSLVEASAMITFSKGFGRLFAVGLLVF